MDEPQDGRPASRQSAPVGKPRARRSARFQAEVLQSAALDLRASSTNAHNLREALAEDAPRAVAIDATEPTDSDAQTNRPTAPGKIGERSLVVAVNTRGLPLTQRADPRPAGGYDDERKPLLLNDQLTQMQANEVGDEV